MTPLAFMSSPYTLYEPDIGQAAADAARLAARLIETGLHIYSPIVHSHSIALLGHLDPMDIAIWYPLNETMLHRCDTLIVARLPTWEKSKGMAMEIRFFERKEKPIFDLDVVTLTMTRRTLGVSQELPKALLRMDDWAGERDIR